jgi:hypothetical protein
MNDNYRIQLSGKSITVYDPKNNLTIFEPGVKLDPKATKLPELKQTTNNGITTLSYDLNGKNFKHTIHGSKYTTLQSNGNTVQAWSKELKNGKFTDTTKANTNELGTVDRIPHAKKTADLKKLSKLYKDLSVRNKHDEPAIYQKISEEAAKLSGDNDPDYFMLLLNNTFRSSRGEYALKNYDSVIGSKNYKKGLTVGSNGLKKELSDGTGVQISTHFHGFLAIAYEAGTAKTFLGNVKHETIDPVWNSINKLTKTGKWEDPVGGSKQDYNLSNSAIKLASELKDGKIKPSEFGKRAYQELSGGVNYSLNKKTLNNDIA